MSGHHSDRHREIATMNRILLSEIGSGLHGVTIAGTDDHDEMGICIPPPECVVALEPFEQYQDRWHADGTRIPEGQRSGPGDTDHVTYSPNKWVRLAAQGNPTVLMVLFSPDPLIELDPYGQHIRDNKHLFITKEAGRRFHGYLVAQKERMLGERGRKHTNRPELVEQFGFDTKCAYHSLRLAAQGIELMNTGTVTLPMRPADVEYLRDVRNGEYTLDEVVDNIEAFSFGLDWATEVASLPDEPDWDLLNAFVIELHTEWWRQMGIL